MRLGIAVSVAKKPFSFFFPSTHPFFVVRHYFWEELLLLPNPTAQAATTTTTFSTPPPLLHLQQPAVMLHLHLQHLLMEHLLSLSAPCKG